MKNKSINSRPPPAVFFDAKKSLVKERKNYDRRNKEIGRFNSG